MRIASVCYWNAFRDDGIAAKIRQQASLWRAAGHDVEILCLSRAPAQPAEPVLGDRVFTFGSRWERLAAGRALTRAVLAFEPAVVYLRYDLFPPTVFRLFRRAAVVVEVQTNDLVEYRQTARSLYNRLNRRVVLGRAAGIVSVSRELARSPAVARFSKLTAVIANGALPEDFDPLPPADNERARLAFLGGQRFRWYGIDKIRELAALLPEFDFDLIGPDPARLRQPLPANVIAHGFLPRDAYEAILARADVGIGTLALHRIGMDEASPLKVREYLLYGLPVVIGYEDTDLVGEDLWFVLRLPNIETNVVDNVSRIKSFVEETKGRRVPRELIDARLDARGKEADRLAFLRKVLAARTAR
jgi:glycosyltransferase involved in cell wall biosynthesis